MIKLKIMLIAFLTVFSLNTIYAQSHNPVENAACRFSKKPFYGEGAIFCAACRILNEKEDEAKKIEAKKSYDKLMLQIAAEKAKKQADEAARLKAIQEKQRIAREEEKSRELTVGNAPGTGSSGSSSSSQSSSSSSSGSTSTTPSSTYQQIPDSYTGNPLHYNKTTPSVSTDKFTQNVEAVGEFANAVAPLLEEWGNNIRKRRDAEQKRAQEKAELLAQKNMKNGEDYFKTRLDKYLKAAENGDDNARMILVANITRVAMWYSYAVGHLLPNADKWVIEAAKNKNNFAMNIIGSIVIYNRAYQSAGLPTGAEKYGMDYKQGLLLLEESAGLGSLDAMLTLANYYNRKGKNYGSNAEKALYYFSEAAKKGSPTAMYNLGLIYRYKVTDSNGKVKYKIVSNDSISFSWFTKSATYREYEKTMFGEFGFEGGSKFEISSYKELAIMYEKGIGCAKDKEIASKLMAEYMK